MPASGSTDSSFSGSDLASVVDSVCSDEVWLPTRIFLPNQDFIILLAFRRTLLIKKQTQSFISNKTEQAKDKGVKLSRMLFLR